MMTISPEQQATFINKRNLLVPPVPQEDENVHQKESQTKSTPVPQDKGSQLESTLEVLVSSSQPQDKGKAPITEASDDDDDETEEEMDPAQFRLARRRPGSSKITI